MTIENLPIDVNRYLVDLMGEKAKYVPEFIRRRLRNFIHQDEYNEFLLGKGNVSGIAFLDAVFEFLDDTIRVEGGENLPDLNGRYTFVSNHPLGAFDGVSICWGLAQMFGEKVLMLVNDFLMQVKGLQPFCVPLNRRNGISRESTKDVTRAFDSDSQMLLFPAGSCSRKRHGEIVDLDWKKAFITESIRSKRDVIPLYFEGSNSNRFYRWANFFDHFPHKANFAMTLLPDEVLRNRHKTFTIKVGKCIPWQTFDLATKSARQWAATVKDICYSLR